MRIIINGYEVVFELILLPIVRFYFRKNQEVKASEVPIPKAFGIGTENERGDNLISICFLNLWI